MPGADDESYLFTGDTIFMGDDGRWRAGYLAGISEAGPLAESLELLATVAPDVVISSAAAVHTVNRGEWADCVAQASSRLTTVSY